jgi:large subunit ribosomal protein L18
MSKVELGKKRRFRRKKSIRKKINGTSNKPRLSVYKSNKFIYVQAIDDDNGITIVSASSLKYDSKDGKLNIKTAAKVGEEIANKLKEKKIEDVVFDRNAFLYTGKIKALADSARKNGLKF